jgi:putative ABC transport system permease protein
MLFDSYQSRVEQLPADTQVMWEVWMPEAAVSDIGPLLAADLRAGLDKSVDVIVSRTDWASRPEMKNSSAMFELVTGAIAGLVLLLGGLGLVNIQLVAMRQRIREIGVRRSFGATGSRIFSSVMLESVVATAVAGVFGIAIAVAVLKAPFVLDMFQGMQDVPPFPMRAAITGLVAAVAIGALAGFIPALVAVRSNVIDALRF